jgi:hypothetical protein
VLAAALNGVLQEQVTAERRLASVLTGAPDAVRAAVRDLLPNWSLRELLPRLP